jgi:hypothetical protein
MLSHHQLPLDTFSHHHKGHRPRYQRRLRISPVSSPYAAASHQWQTRLHLAGGKSVPSYTGFGLRRGSLLPPRQQRLPSSWDLRLSSSSPLANDSFITGPSSSSASTAYRLHLEGLGLLCILDLDAMFI